MAFIDPEFYQGSPLEEETEQRVAAEEAENLKRAAEIDANVSAFTGSF